MKYLSANSNSLFVLQIISLIIIVVGALNITFSWPYIVLSVLFFYLYSIVGVSMMLHRYYSHKSFALSPLVKWLLTSFAVLAGRGSPIGWVYIHRIHHATSDSQQDPHSPHNDNFKFIGFRPIYDTSKPINYFIVKELLTPAHKNIDKYYMLFILFFISVIALIDLKLVFYIWAIPVFAVSISQVAFNYFCHMKGYRNFDTKDHSTNNIYMWPFILGDAWHNNHHARAGNLDTKVYWWEFDPVTILIDLIKVK